MLKLYKSLISNTNLPIILRSCSTNPGSSTQEKWDLYTAICLERKPAIVPEMSEIEKEFMQQLTQVENEQSFKSNHEVRLENDLRQQELLKLGEADLDKVVRETAQDFAFASLEELKKFEPANTLTEADKSNNTKSLNRKLSKHLVLLIEKKLGKEPQFLLPQGIWKEGETLRQTAERVLKSSLGDNIKAQLYGNAPVGFYKYKYPKEVQNIQNAVGGKIFFYFARYKSGSLPENLNYKWLDRNELDEVLPTKYCKNVREFLIDE